MPAFTLALYRNRAGSNVKEGLGELTFEAADTTVALARARALYPERLMDCDYAMITGEDGKLVWEKARDDA